MHLVVVIPALNEAATIAEIVGRVPRSIVGVERVDVVVVDDGSSDLTAELARGAGATVIGHGRNRGLGQAFASGVRETLRRGADVMVNIDGDGQFNPEDIPQLIAPILRGEVGFVTCTRFADAENTPDMPWIKYWGNQRMTALIRRICGRDHLSDVSCGFRAYSRDTLLRLTLFGDFTYTQETFIQLASQGVAMGEVPLKVQGVRSHGNSRMASSISRYAVKTASIILRAMRDVKPLTFFGIIAMLVALIGVLLGAFVFGHWLQTGHTQPYRSLLIGSAVGIVLGFLLFILALIADMLNRLRHMLAELLFLARGERYPKSVATSATEKTATSRLP